MWTTAEIIQELINIAKEIKEADKEGEKLGLTQDEVAFYNALEINDSAVQVLGDETLKTIAREIATRSVIIPLLTGPSVKAPGPG